MSGEPRRGPVLLDVQATQSADHRDRGVARYTADLAAALLRRRPDLVHTLLLNRRLAPPGNVEPLIASGRLAYSDAADLADAGALHVMSPFELDVPLHELWPVRADTRSVPLIVTLYDVIPEVFPERYLADPGLRARYRARMELVRAAAAVLCISEATAADAVERAHVREDRVTVIGGAASPYFGPPASRAAAWKAARLALPDLAERFVLYTAGLDDRKNFERLFASWGRLRPEIRDRWQLVMVCQLHDLGRNHLQHLAREVGIEDRLLLPGFVRDDTLRWLYQSCDLTVFPSLYEGLGLPIAEALACGAPTIGSDIAATRELLEPYARFDPTDEEAMAAAIDRSLTDEGSRSKLVAQCERTMPTWDDVADRTAVAYERVLSVPRVVRRRARPLVAVVTPLPPAASGIATYSYKLLDALRAHCDVHAFADGERWVPSGWDGKRVPDGVELSSVRSFVDGETAHRGYDGVLYCLGNSEYHAGALAALRRRPGFVLAHEPRMTDLYALAIDEPGAVPDGFAATLANMYRDVLPADARGLGRLPGTLAERLGLLMAREVVELADRFVVMSEYAANLVRLDVRPEDAGKIVVAPFAFPAPVDGATATDVREHVVATFGVVNEVKQTTLLVEALPALLERVPDASLTVVGRCGDDERARLFEVADALGVRTRLTITGDVDDATYAAWLDRAAVAVQLRRSSNGECSAAAGDCIAAGAALVVTDIAAARELPEAVARKVPAEVGSRDLAVAIADLLTDLDRRRAMVDAAFTYARAHDFAGAAESLYHDVIAPSLRMRPSS